jgi:hypothetical protein
MSNSGKNKYIIRHDKLFTHLHYSICKKLGIETTENWYYDIPKSLTEYKDIIMLWNHGGQADRKVLVNRPDIIVKNKKDSTCLLIGVAILSDKNIIQKEAEKKLQCKILSIEIKQVWSMKFFVITGIIGATGIVNKSL